MCVIRMAAVGILVALVLAPACVMAEQKVEDLLLEGMQAETGDSPLLAREKFKQVIEKDPANYHALVRLAQLEMKQLSSPKRGDMSLAAKEYLLRASLAQPDRPEAYLALAQLHYLMGYIEEGDEYARMAKNINPESYEAFCLMGQRYEDSGNLLAAMRQYGMALEYHPYDVYLSERRYIAAASGGLQPYDIYSVDLKDVGTAEGGGSVSIQFELIYEKYPDFNQLVKYEQEAGVSPRARGRYFLPDFGFKYCRKGDKPTDKYGGDVYEAFIKASTTDPAEYARLRAEVDKIKKEALEAVAAAKSDARSGAQSENVAKAKALYTYLKTKILKEYDIKKGVSAKDLIEQKRYLCLNSSILFALLGKEAGLPIDGFIRPGHAYTVLRETPRNLPIDMIPITTAGTTGDKGFGVSWKDQFEALNQPGNYGGLYPGASDRSSGQVSPDELRAYQFVNVLAAGLADISDKHKDEEDLIRNLLGELIQDNRETQTQILELKNRLQQEPERLAQLINKTREKHLERKRSRLRDVASIRYKIDKEKSTYLSQSGLGLMEAARGIGPRVEEFVDIQEIIYALKADTDARQAKDVIRDREQRRDDLWKDLTEKKLSREFEIRLPGGRYSQQMRVLDDEIKVIQARLDDLDKEAREKWPTERNQWIEAIKGLTVAHKKMPCSNKIQRRLEAYLWSTAKTAEKMGDNETLQEVVSLGLSRLPDSEFAKHYRAGQL